MRPTFRHIVDFVADRRGIPVTDIMSSRRDAPTAAARQEVCFLARRLTPDSLPAIGRALGGRDHTTIIHAINRVAAKTEADPAYAREIAAMSSDVNHAASRPETVRLTPPGAIDPVAAARRVMESRHRAMTVSADEIRAMAMAIISRKSELDVAAPLRRIMPAVRDVVAAAAARDQAQYSPGEPAARRRLRKSLSGLRAVIADTEKPKKQESRA